MTNEQAPPHPGEVLRKEYMEPFGLTGNKLALALHVSPPRITEIVIGRRGVTADTALRLSKCFNTSPQYWLTLQMEYDIATARKSLGDRLEQEVRPVSVERQREADADI